MTLVRTRFAPSPTGFLHVGGVRTALFAWLLARQSNGQFVLRLEDTDQSREVKGSDQHIMDSLRALGLDYDEGPDIGGEYGPYRQSERLSIYRDWADRLVAAGRAYADPYSIEELEALREKSKAAKQPFLFRDHRPIDPPTWDGNLPLRFKSEPKSYQWQDAVMGELSAEAEAIDDFIIIKSDGYPTYNFAHIIDDHLMHMSHVIRSQEFLASTPRFLNLYEALEIEKPILATVPFVMGPGGKKKLSKRDGAKDVLDYIRDGYLADALINFMASMGWNDGTEQEVFSRHELIAKFSLERVGRSGAQFDEQRLLWLNGQQISQLSLDELFKEVDAFWPVEADSSDDSYKKEVLAIVQDRLKYFAELPGLTDFFFTDLPINPSLINSHKHLSKLTQPQLIELLQQTLEVLTTSDFSFTDITSQLNQLLVTTGQKPAVLFSLIRIATTQAPNSPGLAETLVVLGQERSLQRIQAQIAALQS